MLVRTNEEVFAPDKVAFLGSEFSDVAFMAKKSNDEDWDDDDDDDFDDEEFDDDDWDDDDDDWDDDDETDDNDDDF